jgi:lipid-A-disaccharide synthase
MSFPAASGTAPFRLFVIAGEPSGDQLAASFITALAARLAPRRLEINGIGGLALQRLGLVSRFAQTDIQLMGVIAVLKSLPTLLSHITDTADAIVDQKPDLVLTVDVPDFSMRVARKVRKAAPSIPIMHWVAPSVWAWRPGRARAMAPHVDRLLALLPFEPAAFKRLDGPPTLYVGHPLLDSAASIRPDADEQRLRDNALTPVILVLPGSRRSEIRHLLPVFRETMRLVAARYPHAHVVIPAVPHLAEAIAADVAGWPVRVEVVIGDDAKRAAFRRARVALATSGTVTLELALSGIPLVGAYRGNAIEGWVAGKLVKSHSVLLCNLVLGRNIAPEFMQKAATAPALAAALMEIIPDGPARAAQVSAFAELDGIMALPGGQASADAAVDAALDLVAQPRRV